MEVEGKGEKAGGGTSGSIGGIGRGGGGGGRGGCSRVEMDQEEAARRQQSLVDLEQLYEWLQQFEDPTIGNFI